MIVAILLLMLAGGAIAYAGDWIGLSMGKRRLSVFGLRPRSTARLFTIAAGVLIALFTFTILFGLDSGFRLALRQGTELIRTNYALSNRNRRLETEVAAGSLAAQNAVAAAATANAARTRAEADSHQAELHLKHAQLAGSAALKRLKATSQKLASTSQDLSAVRFRLADAQVASSKLQGKIDSEQSIIRRLGPTIARLMSNRQTALQSTLLYRNGQEIGRTAIRSDQRVADIRQEISAFLLRLSVKGQRLGAARGHNGRTVQVADVAVLHIGPRSSAQARAAAKPTFYGEMDNITALAEQIHAYSNGKGSVVLIARAYGNEFAGEQSIIRLEPYGDHLALPKGTQLAQLTIPLSDDNGARMTADLQELLEMARSSAMRAGVIPVENPQAHESDLGAIKLGDLFTIADEVRHVHGPAVVTAIAAQDTYSADSLRLQFTVAAAPKAAGEARAS